MGAVNHVAVWVAGSAPFILGAGWYTVLGGAWLAAIGKTEAQIKADQPNMAISLWLINSGYMVAGMAVMDAIIGGWKRKV